jgi:ABC-type multidrug transport system permease subunit
VGLDYGKEVFMPATLIAYLQFAFVFFGVWCFKDAALSDTPPAVIRSLIVGLLFVLIAWVIGVATK